MTTTAIEGFFAGDDLDVQRDVTGIITSDPVDKAWLTIKLTKDVADPGILQKIITTSQVPGTGQITQDGAEGNGDGTASMVFELTAANTTTLGTTIRYRYDVQVRTAGAKIYTVHDGEILFLDGITDATS